MFDPSSLLVSAAYAQTNGAPAPVENPASMMNFVPFILIFIVFYVLVIRPQQKAFSVQDKMLKALKKGDRVVTSCGIHGKVTKIDDAAPTSLELEVAEGVRVIINRDNIASLEAKPNDAANDATDNGKK